MSSNTPLYEDKIQQIFKFLEVADITEFHGKNVLEATDADNLHDILLSAFEQVYNEGVNTSILDIVAIHSPPNPRFTVQTMSIGGYPVAIIEDKEMPQGTYKIIHK